MDFDEPDEPAPAVMGKRRGGARPAADADDNPTEEISMDAIAPKGRSYPTNVAPPPPPAKRMGFSEDSATPADAAAKFGRRAGGDTASAPAAGNASKWDREETVGDLQTIPDLEVVYDSAEADITTQVADAPHARARTVQSLTELDSDAMFALPSAAAQGSEGIDFALLSSVLYPQAVLLEADEPWDVDTLLSDLATQMAENDTPSDEDEQNEDDSNMTPAAAAAAAFASTASGIGGIQRAAVVPPPVQTKPTPSSNSESSTPVGSAMSSFTFGASASNTVPAGTSVPGARAGRRHDPNAAAAAPAPAAAPSGNSGSEGAAFAAPRAGRRAQAAFVNQE
jgi:hypothetical protein